MQGWFVYHDCVTSKPCTQDYEKKTAHGNESDYHILCEGEEGRSVKIKGSTERKSWLMFA